ncbi:probable NOT transcription complex subunit VIP2 isoform X1 [Nymphaea colorata]|nr:probable NOT transcription complex subunit VIP2 isoform X1 [Nymphaea colorata]
MATSLFQSTLNGSNSSLPDPANLGRSFGTSFASQSGSTPVFHHSGAIQALHNVHGSFNVANIPGSLTSRNSALGGVSSPGGQQPSGSLSSGRFASNNLSVSLSQLSQGSLHGHSGVSNRGSISVVGSPSFTSNMNGVGGPVPGITPASASFGNRNAVPGLGVSPFLDNIGSRLPGSGGTIVGANNIAQNINSGAGLNVPGLASRGNLTANNGSLNMQGSSRLTGGVLQQAPQMFPMLGRSYSTSGGPLAQNQARGGNSSFTSLGVANGVNSNDSSPFDINDFPQLTGRPSSAGGPQGQSGSLRKQGVGISSMVQPSQEFSIQNEDFPALPGFKGNSADYAIDLHQKDAHHENAMSIMQPQHFPMSRPVGFNLAGTYIAHRQQQLQQQQQHSSSASNAGVSYPTASTPELLQVHGSDLFPSSRGLSAPYHSQVRTSGVPNLGLRPVSTTNLTYEQLLQQYHHPNQSHFHLQTMSAQQSYGDQSVKPLQSIQAAPDRFGLLGLLNVIKMSDPDLTSLALGIDLTTLGLNLNSRDNLYKTFASPWSDGPVKGDPEYSFPQCYLQPTLKLQPGYFSRFRPETLFYIFYSMPKDEAQLYAANELVNLGWIYHKELRLWLFKAPNVDPLVRTHTYERGTYLAFDPNIWETVRKENFILHYDMIENRPTVPQQH